ncbi:hypothetical protein ASPZODRAFT_1583626 [Penicilliopsis zonata CBS 506.65]|uniref:Uncharacterized protein n=1 Tax=Penicilliopsis zonata CBS 506.65 TaxID=1073090 RepID=A0A1L9SMX4_9EURO|nr:hypothetical protein ASPZODRAFT_1583626 [Penicilliopsis zonata CBS 506.65]OJJ48387.1 hypothetical protein ASPZODRAFT_1583626 [Penicilliopsis zonata CBS 506.65]
MGNIAAVRSFLDLGISVDAVDSYKVSLLAMAASCNQIEVAKLLIERGAKPLDEYPAPLALAVLERDLSMVTLLLDNGATMSYEAALFILSYCDLDTYKQIKYQFSVKRGDVFGNTMLQRAAENTKHSEIFHHIVADLDSDEYSLDHRNDQGETALMVAIDSCNLSVVKLLISAKHRDAAGLRLHSRDGNYPIHKAILAGSMEMVKMLVKADPAVVIDKGALNQTPIHLAVECNKMEILEFLFRNGAKISGYNTQGLLPLHLAVQHRNTAMVRFLLRFGSPNITNSANGLCPSDLARRLKYHGTASIIEQWPNIDPSLYRDHPDGRPIYRI